MAAVHFCVDGAHHPVMDNPGRHADASARVPHHAGVAVAGLPTARVLLDCAQPPFTSVGEQTL
jgi:hypothetical protein